MEKLAAPLRKDLGISLTPGEVVDFLVRWAIRSPDDVVIDPGTGEGAFILAAFNRLEELGADGAQAAQHLYGAEYYDNHFATLTTRVRQHTGHTFPHLHHADIFDVEFPQADAVIGNPPYVIRHRVDQAHDLRSRVALRAGENLRRRQADLYSYFIMYAASFLKEGGRLAIIVSDSWLDTDFGVELKSYLLRNFKLRALISFDKRVFADALVKTVILLAERDRTRAEDNNTHFIRIKRMMKLRDIEEYLASDYTSENGLKAGYPRRWVVVSQRTLDPRHYWGIYFKAPELFSKLSMHPLFTELGNLAETRIGLQTLAKKFYIVPADTIKELGLESEYFEPIAVSPREILVPVLDRDTPLPNAVLLCSEEKGKLQGTNLLKYISAAEAHTVEVRTKREQVQGYHNLSRLQKARRQPWYNLKTEIDRRGRYAIFFPRRVYQTFLVFWNKRGVIANEDFIEVEPRRREHLLPLLAVLNSSVAEFMARSLGHIYGGGVCNLNPNDLRILPVLDLSRLNCEELDALTSAYQNFIADESKRHRLDEAIFGILGEEAPAPKKFYAALDELRTLSTGLKKL